MFVEPHHVCLSAQRHLTYNAVAAVQDREIVCAGELDRFRLEVGVSLEGAVAVEVVGRDVQDHADVEARSLHRLELEAGQLEHDPVPRRHLVQAVENGVADVAADEDRPIAGCKNGAGERGRRRLAVGAGDADDRPGAQAQEQVDLAGNLDAPPSRVIQELGIPLHTRAGIHDVDTCQHRIVVAPKLFFNAGRQQSQRIAQLRLALHVDDAHAFARPGEVPGQRDAAARRAHHERRHVISRATPAAASAETSPAPQKESGMRFSDQPSWWNV